MRKILYNARRAVAWLRELLARPEPESHAFRWRDLLFFLRFVRPVWRLGVASLALVLAASAVASVLPLSPKILIDFVVMRKGPEDLERMLGAVGLTRFVGPLHAFLLSLNHVIGAVFVLTVLSGLCFVAYRFLVIRFQQEMTFHLQTALFDHVLRFPLNVFRDKQTGYLMSRISDDVHALQTLFSMKLTQLLTHLFYLGFGLAVVFTLSRRLALIALAALPLYVLINWFFADRIRHVSKRVMENRAQVSRDLQESIAGVEVVKSYGQEQQEVSKVSRGVRAVIRTRIKSLLLSTISGNLVEGCQLVTLLLITWFGVREIQAGRMTIGDFVAFNSYIVYLSGPVRTLSVFHLGLQPILASLERLMEIFRMTPETASAAGGQGERLQAVAGRVEFRGVSFAYRSGFPVLRDVAFAAEPGDVVALVGPSGAGKSTLVSLLLAFYRPDAGAILLDGRDVRGLDTVWLRRQIGFVPQEGFLFADTVRNNIRYGNPSASDEAVIEAARAANVHEDIVALPEGYDTIAGERGSKLSVGQKQRVSIARAFLNNPPILVFDEPTSALDARSEALLKDSLSRLLAGRTTFIIAHRLSTISLARRIIVLDQGRLVENGTHEELLAHGSLYRQLYDSHRTAV